MKALDSRISGRRSAAHGSVLAGRTISPTACVPCYLDDWREIRAKRLIPPIGNLREPPPTDWRDRHRLLGVREGSRPRLALDTDK